MPKIDREFIEDMVSSESIFAVVSAVGGILKLSGTFLGVKFPRVASISTYGLQGILVLVCLGFLWNLVDTMLMRATSGKFKSDGGFLNPSVIVSLVEVIMMLVCIKMMFFYPLNIGGNVTDVTPLVGSKFGLFGAIFAPYIFSECLKLLLSYKKNMKRDKILLAIIIVGCLVMGGLGVAEYRGKGNYIGAGLFGIGLLMLLARLGLIHEEDSSLLEEEEDFDKKPSTEECIIMGATFLLVLVILGCSHKILFDDNSVSFLEHLKSLSLFGKLKKNMRYV